MTTWDYYDYDTGADVPEHGKLSPVRLAHEHRERWVLQTSKGAIVLRRMPLRLYRVLELARQRIYPRLTEMLEELQSLKALPEGAEGYEEAQTRIMDLATALVMTDPAPLGVVVSPSLASMDDYEELYTMLDEVERVRLVNAVMEMSRIIDPAEVDPIPDMVAERLGIKLADPSMVEAMTVSQASYWHARIQAEKTALDRMARR
jgi:hypothetical protein